MCTHYKENKSLRNNVAFSNFLIFRGILKSILIFDPRSVKCRLGPSMKARPVSSLIGALLNFKVY